MNSVTSKYVEPIPVDPPTLRSISNPIPVSVVAPIPNLETPTTGKFSYAGSETNISGLLYPVPPAPTLNDNVPPTPTDAVIVATSPVCPSS